MHGECNSCKLDGNEEISILNHGSLSTEKFGSSMGCYWKQYLFREFTKMYITKDFYMYLWKPNHLLV
jgi:hypothetical protein